MLIAIIEPNAELIRVVDENNVVQDTASIYDHAKLSPALALRMVGYEPDAGPWVLPAELDMFVADHRHGDLFSVPVVKL
jgi:hypothetical protein